MNRRILAVGAAVVLAAVVALYVVLGRTDEPPRVSAERPDRPARVDPLPSAPAAEAAPGKPRKIRDAPPQAPTAGTPTTEYTIGETRIRDHRSGERVAVDVPPPIHPPEGRRVASQLTGNLGQQIQPLLQQCTASLPPGSLTKKSRVEGQIIISIKDHQATITSAALQPRDISEAALADVKQCLTHRAVGLTAPAGDEADLEGYAITLSLALP